MTTEHLESKPSQPATLNSWLRLWGGKILAPMVGALARLGFSPNALTVIGLALNAGAAVLLALGHLSWGGGVILLAGLFMVWGRLI